MSIRSPLPECVKYSCLRSIELPLLFKKVKDNGYVHDVEVVLLSKKYNFPIKELPVAWTHRDDSKLNLLTDTFKMFYNLIKIRKNFI